MAFILRRPFTIPTALKQVPQISSAPIRALHTFQTKSTNYVISKQLSSASATAKSKPIFQNSFRRNYLQPPYQVSKPDTGKLTERLLYGAGITGATLIGINLLFNRETREDGGMPPFERQFLNETFLHTGLGIGIIAVAARALHQNGWSYRLMTMNPWVVIGVSLATSIGTMYACFATSPDK